MKVKILAMAVLAATVMTSCKNSEEDVINNNRVAVKFSANVANVQTRVDGSSWAENDPIGIYMITETPGTLSAGSIAEGVDNYQYKASSQSSTSEFIPTGNTIYYPQDGSSVKFTAYHPYSTSVSNLSLPIDLDNQSSQTDIDVMYAGVTSSSYNYAHPTTPVALSFKHKLTKLVFKIEEDSSVSESLDNLEVKVTGQQTAGSMDLTSGDVTSTVGTSSIEALTVADGTTSEAIVFPSATSGMTFTFKTSSHTYVGNIPDANWAGGSKYIYTVKLQKDRVVIEGSIQDWIEVPGTVTAD